MFDNLIIFFVYIFHMPLQRITAVIFVNAQIAMMRRFFHIGDLMFNLHVHFELLLVVRGEVT
jgi:hypothetical protein